VTPVVWLVEPIFKVVAAIVIDWPVVELPIFMVLLSVPVSVVPRFKVLNVLPAVPVMLAVSVPVKVTAENGPIKPGDYITSSSVSCMGMKATRAGPVIGQALNSFNGDQSWGVIVMFVQRGYFNGQSLDTFAESLVGAIEGEPPDKPTDKIIFSVIANTFSL